MQYSLGSKLYRQASIPLWLTTQEMIKTLTGGCTELDNFVTVGGYSEGGYVAFAIGQSLQRIGVTVLSCNVGATQWNHQQVLQHFVEEFDAGRPNSFHAALVSYAGAAYSSTNPDMVNTDVGQDLLLDGWMNELNFSMWAEGWISSDLSGEEVVGYVPFPNFLQMMNPNATSMLRTATTMNVSDPCDVAIAGETDKLCQAAIENDLADDLASPTFPVVLCHSPDDEVFPKDVLFPDVNASDNLTEFNLLGTTASGSHAEAAFFCLFPMLRPFTGFNQGPSATEQLPLGACQGGTLPPSASPPPNTGTSMPTTSGAGAVGSIAPLVTGALAWFWSRV